MKQISVRLSFTPKNSNWRTNSTACVTILNHITMN